MREGERSSEELREKTEDVDDNPTRNRPERRTALVAQDLARYKVDIAALSETWFSEQGQLQEMDAGYTFIWSARPKAERRDAGVAFAKEGHLDASSITSVAPVEPCPRLEARPAGRDGDKGDSGC
nr:unnamed protein product [Spirometra erinaceieuropaei]